MRQFDRWIKGELDQFEASRPDAAWDMFASRMTQEDQQAREEDQFDQAVKHKLDPYEASYTSNGHWHQLREKLEAQARIRSEMIRIKLLEAALFVLIFMTLWQLQPVFNPTDSSTLPLASQIERHSHDGNTPELDQLPTTDIRIPPAGTTKVTSSIQTTGADPLTSTHVLYSSRSPQLLIPAVDLIVQTAQASRSSSPSPQEYDDDFTADLSGPLDLLPNTAIASLPNELQVLPGLTVQQENVVRHRVSMAINGDINYIMTPYDQLLVKRGYDQLVSGYGGSIGYAWEWPRWALRTSLAYHRKYYLPKPYTEVFDGDFERGYFSATLRDIELNLLSLSVQGQRTISRRNRWHTYGLIGGTGHMAFQANYDRKESYTPGVDPQGGEIPEPLVPSKTSQKRYADGFFEGGSFAENSYFTVDLGVGIERHLNERASLFFEPVYQHNPFRKSLGPNQDRINTLSLSTGIRVNL